MPDHEHDKDGVLLDNPAGRLAFFLRELVSYGRGATASPGGSVWDLLAQVVGNTDGDVATTLHRMAAVMDLPNQIEAQIEQTSEVANKFVDLLPPVREFLKIMLSNMQQLNLQLPQDNLTTTVELISDQLSRYAPEPVPDNDELFAIRDEIDELLRSVLGSQIDRDLGQFIIDHLHSLIEAIDTFHISGVVSIRSAISEVIGDIYLGVPGDLAETDDEKADTLGHRLMEILGKLSALINIPAAAITIGNAAAALAAGAPPHIH